MKMYFFRYWRTHTICVQIYTDSVHAQVHVCRTELRLRYLQANVKICTGSKNMYKIYRIFHNKYLKNLYNLVRHPFVCDGSY